MNGKPESNDERTNSEIIHDILLQSEELKIQAYRDADRVKNLSLRAKHDKW